MSGGRLVHGRLDGTPATNTALLAVGTAPASIIGTTGARVLLLRRVLRANAHRARKTHVFVLFIFLMGNIGDALTPLGDPPLYLRLLCGVDFFWPTLRLLLPFLLFSVLLLAAFRLLDRADFAREAHRLPQRPDERPIHRRLDKCPAAAAHHRRGAGAGRVAPRRDRAAGRARGPR